MFKVVIKRNHIKEERRQLSQMVAEESVRPMGWLRQLLSPPAGRVFAEEEVT